LRGKKRNGLTRGKCWGCGGIKEKVLSNVIGSSEAQMLTSFVTSWGKGVSSAL
jgi:hypothetical protein